MALLDTIKRAASGGNDAPSHPTTNFPVILDGEIAFKDLTCEDGDAHAGSLTNRVVGWKIPKSDEKNIKMVETLAKKLRRKLKNSKSLGDGEIQELLNSLPKKKLKSLVGGELIGLIAEACVALAQWETLESLILNGLIGFLGPKDLPQKLLEKKQPGLLCLYAKNISEIGVQELSLMLEFFLSPPGGSRESFMKVREEWEREGLLALEKATQKGLTDELTSLAREASILLMMAIDGFSSSELCLHSLFSSPNLEGIFMSSAISKLGSLELLRLIRYLRKWLEKYERFPECCSCPEAGPAFGMKFCQLVPSLESVVMGLGLVIDEHYSYLVLNSQFHDELSSIRRVVESLVSSAGLCCSVFNAIENLWQSM
ncbi:uncharacterized protein LOC144701266 [Wolffia australiana]